MVELLLAGAPWLSAIGKLLLAGDAIAELLLARGAMAELLLAGGIAAEHCPSVNEIFYPFGCHQFTFFLNFAAVSALRL